MRAFRFDDRLPSIGRHPVRILADRTGAPVDKPTGTGLSSRPRVVSARKRNQRNPHD